MADTLLTWLFGGVNVTVCVQPALLITVSPLGWTHSLHSVNVGFLPFLFLSSSLHPKITNSMPSSQPHGKIIPTHHSSPNFILLPPWSDLSHSKIISPFSESLFSCYFSTIQSMWAHSAAGAFLLGLFSVSTTRPLKVSLV